jgi:two-component system sensor histidine kinase KdpD
MTLLAHDLRSPLTAIRGAATLLLSAADQIPPDRARQLLSVIDGQAASMADRIEDLLVASRLQNGALHLTIESFDLADVIADALDAARARHPDRRIRASGRVEGRRVSADQVRTAQILRILLDQAVRSSPATAGVEVRVIGGVQPRVEVRDRAQQPVPEGDLGLGAARGLAAAMGGKLGGEPRTGGGSTFWFTLPRATK